MIDSHCHILPGLDDGAKNIDESLEMARVLADAGFSEVYCTPHLIKGLYNNSPEVVRNAVKELQMALAQENIALTLHAGMEYYIDEYLPSFLGKEFLPFEAAPHLLVEAPMHNADIDYIKDVIYQIVRNGLVPVLAHPERYTFLEHEVQGSKFKVQSSQNGFLGKILSLINVERRTLNNERYSPNVERGTSNIELFLDMGCKFQGNIGSFAGIYGEQVRDLALRLLQLGLYDRLGTDAHRPQKLTDWLERGLKVIEQEIGKEEFNKLVGMPVSPLVG
jgi:protein-tyrosine phosphatase